MIGVDLMRAATPPARDSEADLDAVIEKIDAALPKIYLLAKEQRVGGGNVPSGVFRVRSAISAQRAFEEMHDNPLLTESKEDIKLDRATDIEDEDATPKNGTALKYESERNKIIQLRQKRR